ncbi:thiamine pyrophosphate-binding protein [Paracoccus sp. MC1862]|uniref:thiamine pyrophosphate-binding protein n=1 Tax=Paracoccus sp. MC1862 TaxID=2760307 RepID=UPI0015FEF500|nr:thiamine pyrophosphate-binding protein [Paracoccus sp. MC1862]MBB1497606.1 thiamine pyrophosphate-binding protein [Paracoccus sp. MC1862]QQO44054.1 thiamine pyrophosphate-binding protein [Paracoccus sp. MC1862]
MRHGGRILADALKAHGVERVFSVPGESFLAALDGLYDAGIPNTVCRQEGGAAMMAEAWGKMTGRPGICFVTRGPGATNASAGVHVARQDSTPMILFVGQIARDTRDREAFQEVDYRQMFGSLAKWVAEIDDTDRIPEYVARAFDLALSGRPGPVVLALPEDMLSAESGAPDLMPAPRPVPGISEAQLAAITGALAGAERPLVIPGGSIWTQEDGDRLARFAAGWGLPVAVPFRRQYLIDNRLPNYVGDLGVGMNPKLGEALREADCILSLGSRLGDTLTNGYDLMSPKGQGKRIIHVYPDPDEIGHLWRADPGIAACPRAVLKALAEAPAPRQWSDWTAELRANYEAWRQPKETPGAVKMERVITWLSDNLPEDAIITNGAGNFASFIHRYFQFKRGETQLAPTSGSMGYGLPAAVAAKIRHPDRTVVCVAGDGDIQMTVNELSTAAQEGAAVIVIVANNGRYGTIRMHQEKHYSGRVSGTDLFNPDFAALARAYGGHGELVERDEDFAGAFQRAQDAGTLAVIELRLDPEALTTGATLSETRAAGMAATAKPAPEPAPAVADNTAEPPASRGLLGRLFGKD